MRVIFIILIVLSIAVFQIALLSSLKLFGFTPNLFLIFVVLASLNFIRKEIFLTAFLSGLVMDLFSVWPFGLFTVTLVCVGFLFSLVRLYVFSQTNLLVILTAVIVGTICFNLLLCSFFAIFLFAKIVTVPTVSFSYIIFYVMPFELVANLVATAGGYCLFLLFARRLRA